MQQVTKHKLVRRGQKYCVRVQGIVNTDDAWHWCRERNMSYHIKVRHGAGYTWEDMLHYKKRWDYDFIFDKPTEATAFILGYL